MLFIGVLWAETILQTRFLPHDGAELLLEKHQFHAAGPMLEALEAAALAGQDGKLFTFCGQDEPCIRFIGSVTEQAKYRIFMAHHPQLHRYILRSSLGEEAVMQDALYEVDFSRRDFEAVYAKDDAVLLDGESILFMKGLLPCLQKHSNIALHVAPGTALRKIRPELMAQLLALHPVFHVTEDVLCAFTHTEDVAAAAAMVCNLSQNAVIVRLQSGDAWLHMSDGSQLIHASKEASASEYHRAGIVLARLEQGCSMKDAVQSSVATRATLKKQNARFAYAEEEKR